MEGRTELESQPKERENLEGMLGLDEEDSDEGDEDVDVDDESRTNGARALALASFVGLTAAGAALGSVANRRSVGLWYKLQRKPPFQPPRWIFAPVWTALYALIATSGYRVWKQEPSMARTRALALWGTQLALNTAWSPLFFGARRKRAALADLAALLGVVAAYAATSRKVDKPAAAMMLPYLGWLGFAGVLNEEIIRRNRGIRRWAFG